MFLGTGAVVVTSVAAAAAPDAFGAVHAALSIGLFAVGTGAMLWAYALGVSRSRTGAHHHPRAVLPRRRCRARADAPTPCAIATAVEIVAVVVAASIRPYTEVAFGILAPMFGLGLMGLWGARYGEFPPRPLKMSG